MQAFNNVMLNVAATVSFYRFWSREITKITSVFHSIQRAHILIWGNVAADEANPLSMIPETLKM